jgi:hypothetical protein
MQATSLLREPASENGVAHDVDVSVVMPCLDEVLTVGRCVDKAKAALRALGIRGEVIVADNGSTDGSAEVAREHGARVVLAERRGYGSALQAGIASATGRYVIMGDADDSYDFSQLEPFWVRLVAGDDLVMGNRFRGGIRPRAMPWLHRYIGNPVLTGILNLFFHTPIRDAHCGLRAFRKDAYLRWAVHSPGMEFASEMVIKANLHQSRISEVPTVLHPDGRSRPPHLRSFRDGWRHLRLLLLLCPQWLYLLPALVLVSTGLGLIGWAATGPWLVGALTLDDRAMLLGGLLLVLGYETLWLWAFAKVFGWVSGLLPSDPLCRGVLRQVNLERGLLVGIGLLILGLALTVWLARGWVDHDGGSPTAPAAFQCLLGSFTAMALGVQTIYGSFFLRMLGMSVEARTMGRQ